MTSLIEEESVIQHRYGVSGVGGVEEEVITRKDAQMVDSSQRLSYVPTLFRKEEDDGEETV